MAQDVNNADIGHLPADEELEQQTQYVTFMLAGERYALPMAPVQEIIRTPLVTRLPMTADAMLGLANLRGHILPVLCLRRMFGLAAAPDSDAQRVLVVNAGTTMGFVVDRVASLMSIDADQLESVQSLQSCIDQELLSAVVKNTDGSLTMVLDVKALLQREFAMLTSLTQAATQELATEGVGEAEDSDDELLELVSFHLAAQEFAVCSIDTLAGRPSVHDIFSQGPAALAPSIVTTLNPLLDVAPANPFYQHSAQNSHPRLLAEALAYEQLAARYQMIVIDTAPSLDILLVNALCAATGVLIPFLPHPLSAEGIRQFSRLFLKVRMQFNPRLQLLALTPVQVNPAVKLHRQIVAELVSQFGSQRMLGSIRTDIKLAEAFAAKLPVLSYAPSSRAAADYRQLCGQLAQLLSDIQLASTELECG